MNKRIPRPRNTIYLDHAAATPVRPEVIRVMQPFWAKEFGNPSTLYALGQHAHQALSKARNDVANTLHVDQTEIIFTAGGSESDTLAIVGAARAFRANHKRGGHILTTAIEHHAVLAAVRATQDLGIRTTIIPVNAEGFVSIKDVQAAIEPDTFLASIMFANNEIGTIQPISAIARMIQAENHTRQGTTKPRILFHTDACQAAGYLELSIPNLGVDLLTLNGSKLYGPKQTGILYVRKGVTIVPLVYGGGQERGLRGGTENVAGAVGFARALTLAQAEQVKEAARITRLRNTFAAQLLKLIPHSRINGPSLEDTQAPLQRLPNNLNISFAGCDGEALVIYLDAYNVAAATGSACATGSTEPSHVLRAIGRTTSEVRGSLRLTLGKGTTASQLQYALRAIMAVVAQQRTTTTML